MNETMVRKEDSDYQAEHRAEGFWPSKGTDYSKRVRKALQVDKADGSYADGVDDRGDRYTDPHRQGRSY